MRGDGGVEVEQCAVVEKQHRSRRCNGLRERGQVEDRIGVHRLRARLERTMAVGAAKHRAVAAADEHHAAWYLALFDGAAHGQVDAPLVGGGQAHDRRDCRGAPGWDGGQRCGLPFRRGRERRGRGRRTNALGAWRMASPREQGEMPCEDDAQPRPACPPALRRSALAAGAMTLFRPRLAAGRSVRLVLGHTHGNALWPSWHSRAQALGSQGSAGCVAQPCSPAPPPSSASVSAAAVAPAVPAPVAPPAGYAAAAAATAWAG